MKLHQSTPASLALPSLAAAALAAMALAALAGCGVTVSRLFPKQADPDAAGGVVGDAAAGETPLEDGPAPETGDGGAGGDLPSADGPEPGLPIGGAWVPRSRAIVLIHVGHSNMAGRASTPAALRPHFYEPHPRLWSYRAEDPITAVGPLLFRPAVEPLAQDTATQGRAGPGMALLRAALARAPDAHVISIGSGQSGATYGLCESYKKGGLFYEYTMRPARALRGRVTYGALLSMFGANEFWGADPTAAALSDCLVQLVADVRAELGAPGLPFLMGDYEMSAWGQYLPSLPGPAAVVAELRMAVAAIERAALVPTQDIPLEDDHHFNLAGHKLWAERAIELLVARGWAPWTTASP